MKRLTIILTILAISIIFAHGAYAAMDDRSDRLSNEQSGVFSPGYINAAKQKTQAIINQVEKNKSPLEKRSDAMDDKLSNKVVEDNADKPKLDLKKKTGGSGEVKAVIEQKNPAGSEAGAVGGNTTPPPSYSADFNGDGVVDASDYITLKMNFGRTNAKFTDGDANGDGSVNWTDLQVILGNFGTRTLTPTPPPVVLQPKVILQDAYQSYVPERKSLDRGDYISDSNSLWTENAGKSASGYADNKLGEYFKNSLIGKNNENADDNSSSDSNLAVRIQNNLGDQSAIALPLEESSTQDMELTLKLSNILANPTEDQKQMLDAMTALLGELNNQENQAGSSELNGASDDLLQMVASILIAQAIPDLLKEGDISSIKNIFAELNDKKGRIVLEYNDSTKPYYDQIVKEMSKNMSILQLKDVLSGTMTKKELENMPRNELDKVLEKIRKSKDRSFEEEYMLQQEAKYRKAYIEPNKKVLEDKMKGMMKEFTGRLSKVLETTKK
ncbi:MAG: dockerin type I domain-containing protein [Candidatus Omnitrophica bacterium]|nr:dockerin type I domain-containing protein [Candidatus Omnitrophota bacterium]